MEIKTLVLLSKNNTYVDILPIDIARKILDKYAVHIYFVTAINGTAIFKCRKYNATYLKQCINKEFRQ